MNLMPADQIQRKIYFISGFKVMLDSDLAKLYNVTTSNLNLAVRRNLPRFPSDFMFQISEKEAKNLILQSAISSWGGRRHQPYVFTEHGVAMLSSVLKSERAIQVNIAIMRAFGRLRELLATHHDLARKLEGLEKKYDVQFKVVFDAIRALMSPPKHPAMRVKGFRP
jgi:hypothetical protein